MAQSSFSVRVNNVQEALELKRVALERALEAVGLHLEGESKEELENDPRRIDTGRLRNSISHAVDMSEPAVYVGTNVEYAPYVHFGTIKMKRNEFIKNAFVRNKEQVKAYIEQELENA